MLDQTNTARGVPNPLLALFEQALESESYAEAIMWLQSTSIERKGAIERPELQDAHARLLARLAYQGIALSLHCGNILREHSLIASQVVAVYQQLRSLIEDPDDTASGALAMLHGLTGQVQLRVSAFHGRGPNFVVTTSTDLDNILEPLFGIIEQSRLLTSSRRHPIGLDERIGAITEALSNADCNIVRWPASFSDWSKAKAMCQLAAKLLATPAASCCAPTGNEDDCDTSQLHAALLSASQACERKDYKESKRLIKAAEGHLAQVSCI